MLLVILLLLRSAWSTGTRVGLPLFVGGGLALLPPLLYQGTLSRLLASGPLSEVPDVVITETTRAILRLAAEIFKPMLLQAIVIIIAGILVIVISMVVGKKKEKVQEAAPDEDKVSEASEEPEVIEKTDDSA